MVGGNLIFDKRGTFLFYFQGSQQGFPTQVSTHGSTHVPTHGSNQGIGTGVGTRCLEHMSAPRNRDSRRPLPPMFQHETHKLSTGYKQDINKNQSLKLGADFKILSSRGAHMVFEKFLGPPFLKKVPCDPHGGLYNVRHQSVKKFFWGVFRLLPYRGFVLFCYAVTKSIAYFAKLVLGHIKFDQQFIVIRYFSTHREFTNILIQTDVFWRARYR